MQHYTYYCRASRNYSWEAGMFCVMDGVGDYTEKVWWTYFRRHYIKLMQRGLDHYLPTFSPIFYVNILEGGVSTILGTKGTQVLLSNPTGKIGEHGEQTEFYTPGVCVAFAWLLL